jgi:hypothetical protein
VKKDQPDEKPPPNSSPSVCYLGEEKTNELCLPLFSDQEIADPNDEFVYKNPYTFQGFPEELPKEQYRVPFAFVDLNREDPSLRLAPFFKLEEVMASRKGRYGLYSPKVIEHLQAIREAAGAPVHMNSGYRSPAYNSATPGSAKWSRHQYGDAVDFESPGVSLFKLAELCEKRNASFILVYTTHVHCDWRMEPLPEEYFGKGPSDDVIPPASMRKTMEAYVSSLEEKTRIRLEKGALKQGSMTQWVVSFPEILHEDHGELLVQWRWEAPSGLRETRRSQKLSLSLKERGIYRLEVVVGGLLKSQKRFFVQ